MIIQNLYPRPPLDKFIHHYNIIDSQGDFPKDFTPLILPSLSTGLLFTYRLCNPIQVKINGRILSYPPSIIVSSTLQPLSPMYSGTLGQIRVVFHPGRLHQLLKVSLQEFTGNLIDTEDILGKRVGELSERLKEAPNNIIRIELINAFLLPLLRDQGSTPTIVDAAQQELLTGTGYPEVSNLAKKLHVSERTLIRRFKQWTGVAPKDFISIKRLCRALDLINQVDRPNLAAIAHACGYYDQPHFNREFKKLMNLSPSTYLKILGIPELGEEDMLHEGMLIGKGKR